MNKWSKESIDLATKSNYLDLLYEVYPNKESLRKISPAILDSIQQSFEAKESVELLNKLLDLKKFPFKDSYVSFLRNDRNAISRNPLTAKRITDYLYKIGFEKMRRAFSNQWNLIHGVVLNFELGYEQSSDMFPSKNLLSLKRK